MNIKHMELVSEAKKFLLERYSMELTIPIEFNSRIKKVLGRFVYERKSGQNIPKKIEMSISMLQFHPKEHIIDVLKHELVHYILCVKNLPFTDGHPVFEGELARCGVSSTHTYKVLGEVHKYKCQCCGKEFERIRKLNKFAYCTCSLGPNLEYIGIFTKKFNVANESV